MASLKPSLFFLLTNINKTPNIRSLLLTSILLQIPTVIISNTSLFAPPTFRTKLLPPQVGAELVKTEVSTKSEHKESNRVELESAFCE